MTTLINRMRGRWSRRTLLIGGLVAALALVATVAAVAAILAKADVTGQVTSGTVSLEWQKSTTGGDGVLTANYVAAGSNTPSTAPTGVACAAEIVGGVLDIQADGLYPGEACAFPAATVKNTSSGSVNALQWYFNGADVSSSTGSGSVFIDFGSYTGGNWVPLTIPTTLAPGATIGATYVRVMLNPAGTADGATVDLTGMAFQGQTVGR